VTVTGPQGTQETTTDIEGRYRVPFLRPGNYRVRAVLAGYTTIEQPNVIIQLGETVDLLLTMVRRGLRRTPSQFATPASLKLEIARRTEQPLNNSLPNTRQHRVLIRATGQSSKPLVGSVGFPTEVSAPIRYASRSRPEAYLCNKLAIRV